MTFDVEEGMQVLSRTPDTLRALLSGLPDRLQRGDEGPDTFTPYDVVGHLIHGEHTDWIPRARRILEHGESRPFEPFDRFAHLDGDRSRTLDELLDEFEELRDRNLGSLRDMMAGAPDLGARGLHPELGSVTLGELLATWVAHDLTHLIQIARTLARQYEELVGPWRAYLSLFAPPADS
jgi:hypothetical protein